MKYRYKIHARRTGYQGFFRLDEIELSHERYGGGWTDTVSRELFERGHAVAVLPYDPLRDEVVLIEQFRAGALEAPGGPWLLEIVAGMIGDGETPEAVARREAAEEAGLDVGAMEPICSYLSSPGGCSERLTLFCGRVDAARAGGVHGLADEHEDIRVLVVSREAALALLADGRIDSAAPVIALQWLALHGDRLRQRWSAESA